MAKCTVKELIQTVLNEVECFVMSRGYMPKQVMVPDSQYQLLRKVNVEYQGMRVHVVGCGRIVDEEIYKSNKNKVN